MEGIRAIERDGASPSPTEITVDADKVWLGLPQILVCFYLNIPMHDARLLLENGFCYISLDTSRGSSSNLGYRDGGMKFSLSEDDDVNSLISVQFPKPLLGDGDTFSLRIKSNNDSGAYGESPRIRLVTAGWCNVSFFSLSLFWSLRSYTRTSAFFRSYVQSNKPST